MMPKFEVDFLGEYTEESILNEIRRVATEHPNEQLSVRNFNKLSGRLNITTIYRKLGHNWEKVLEGAGLTDRYIGQKRLTNDELIVEMKRVFALAGKEYLSRDDFDDNSPISCYTIMRRFGGRANALKIAQIPQSEMASKNWTAAQCFENLADVWIHYQRQPTFREMFRPPSKITGKTYATRWETWRKALMAFADSANSEDQLGEENEEVPVAVLSSPVSPKISQKPEDRREVRPALRIKVFARDHFRCKFCGRSPATHLNITLHADHIVAFVNGGKTILENLQTLCEECNLGKGRMVLPAISRDSSINSLKFYEGSFHGKCSAHRGLRGHRSRSVANPGANHRPNWTGAEKRDGPARGTRPVGRQRPL
jgi:hypothetical protein